MVTGDRATDGSFMVHQLDAADGNGAGNISFEELKTFYKDFREVRTPAKTGKASKAVSIYSDVDDALKASALRRAAEAAAKWAVITEENRECKARVTAAGTKGADSKVRPPAAGPPGRLLPAACRLPMHTVRRHTLVVLVHRTAPGKHLPSLPKVGL
jgi:hypothetical protein